MSKQKYNSPTDALDVLRLAGAGIKEKSLTIKSGTLGLKKIGAVDYLVNYHKYSVSWRPA